MEAVLQVFRLDHLLAWLPSHAPPYLAICPFIRLLRWGELGDAVRGVCGEPCPFFSVLLFGEVAKAGCGGPTPDVLQLLHETLLVFLIILCLILLPG